MPNKARKNDMHHFAAPFYKAKAENAIPKVNVKISSTNQIHFRFIVQPYTLGGQLPKSLLVLSLVTFA